jgi:hypothetical protein
VPCANSPMGCTGKPACRQLERVPYQATDGSLHEAWEGDGTAQRDAAIASAVRDLPCAQSSVVVVDNLTLEGCGQRVTYRAVANPREASTRPGHAPGFRYVVVDRVAIPVSAPLQASTQ